MPEDSVKVTAVRVQQSKHSFLLLKLRAADLVRIAYVAARGVAKEKGAVQRLLTKSRIAGISDFASAGGDFPASIVLNWVSTEHEIKESATTTTIPLEPASAQLLDGQHRVEGLREAIKTKRSVADTELPVTIYSHLSTQECADIFLSINTEQKPVSRNLVYDLYGIASGYVRDDEALAAKEIADSLNTRKDSPYQGMIRYPGPSTNKHGGIALSSVVGVLKPLLATNGPFEQVGLTSEYGDERIEVLLNWLKVIRDAYGTQWADNGNVFRYASGFWGAIDFLSTTMLKHCHINDAFDLKTMKSAMKGLKDNLIWQHDVKGMQGRTSANLISRLLGNVFSSNRSGRTKFKV